MRNIANPSDREALIRRLERLTPTTPTRWGIMTATQMLQHVVLAYRMSLDELATSEAVSRKFDSPLYRFAALSLPIPWPKGVAAPRELDFTITPPLPAEFSQEHRNLVGLIHRAGETALPGLRSVHPIFGRLSYKQWMRWCFRHTDHHLRQFGC